MLHMLDLAKVKLLLKSLELNIEKSLISPVEDLNDPEAPIVHSYTLYRTTGLRERVGELTATLNDIDNLEEHQIHLDRIDIDKQHQSKGLGSVLLAYFLCDNFQEGEINECLLQGFSNNFTFYCRAGFCVAELPEELNIEDWYKLSVEDKKSVMYEQEKENCCVTQEEFFKEEIVEIKFVFDNKNPKAQAVFEQSIDSLINKMNGKQVQKSSERFFNANNQNSSKNKVAPTTDTRLELKRKRHEEPDGNFQSSRWAYFGKEA